MKKAPKRPGVCRLLKTLSIDPAPGIKPAKSRTAVNLSSPWASHPAEIPTEVRVWNISYVNCSRSFESRRSAPSQNCFANGVVKIAFPCFHESIRSYFTKTNVHLLLMRLTTKKMRTLTVNVSCFSGISYFHFVWLAIYFALFSIFSSLSVSASDLISRLVRGEVCRSGQIQSHPFFKGVNWNEVSCTQFSYIESSCSLVNRCTPKVGRYFISKTLGMRLYEYSRFTPIC